MKNLHITVPVDGYGNTPEEVQADCFAEAAKVFTCDPSELAIEGPDLVIQKIDSGTTDARREKAAGRKFWASVRVARKPRTKVTEIIALDMGAGTGSPMLDTLQVVSGFLMAMTGRKPELGELVTEGNSNTVTISTGTHVKGKLSVTVTHEWPPEDSDG